MTAAVREIGVNQRQVNDRVIGYPKDIIAVEVCVRRELVAQVFYTWYYNGPQPNFIVKTLCLDNFARYLIKDRPLSLT